MFSALTFSLRLQILFQHNSVAAGSHFLSLRSSSVLLYHFWSQMSDDNLSIFFL